MIHTEQKSSEYGLGREAADVFQEAINPNWLMKVIKITSAMLVVLVILAIAL